MRRIVLLLAVALQVSADVYLHGGPRGSNNRLNEKSAERRNANRLFDSQNNNRGGYNVGDITDDQAKDESGQYRMKYFQSGPRYKKLRNEQDATQLTIEWTNQHGCGGNEDTDPHKQNCQIVLQYMCQPNTNSPTGARGSTTFRNGISTNTQEYTARQRNPESASQRNARRVGDQDLQRGEHESWYWYDNCYERERNHGLFTADQKLEDEGRGYSSAIHTRQNPNGNQYGYECPEERDYFPYWHPTPWKDIAILAENATMCEYYKEHSFNVKSKFECVEKEGNVRLASRWNNEEDCRSNGGTWTEFFNYLEKVSGPKSQSACQGMSQNGIRYKWEVPYDSVDGLSPECLVMLDEPDCKEAPWTRSNHLGNGRDGVPNNYTWTIPHFPSGDTQRCVFRIRYNISTDDYDPYRTDSRHSQDLPNMVRSPVQQNPYVEVGWGHPLRLAINTAQFGRTFQDRTHVFLLEPRPSNTNNRRIVNLNVRGKRGNIVQVYPAVEYDFIPNDLHLTERDLVHIQWTGSNTHNNGNPGGDGQTGDAGEGKAGTDRNNIVQINDLNENMPVPFENSTMWTNAQVVWIYHGNTRVGPKDLAINLASSGFFECITGCTKAPGGRAGNLQSQLDNAPASYPGVLLSFKKGSYFYICSRNNNFTNRSQKGAITVT